MSSVLYSLGRTAHRRWRVVLVVWAVVLGLAGTAALTLNQGTTTSFSIPGTESQRALDRLSATFPQASGASLQLVVQAQGGDVEAPDVLASVEDVVAALEATPEVEGLLSPVADGALTEDAQVSDDGRTLLLVAQLDRGGDQVTDDMREHFLGIAERATEGSAGAATWTAGGDAFGAGPPHLGATELVGLAVAAVVLTLTLGSLLAAGMPLLTALTGVGLAMAVTFAATRFVDLSSTAPMLAVMIGIAVGIDYALFVLARHRDQLGEGVDPEESTGRSVATAGSAVVFAGLTVMIALAGLAVAGIPFLTVMGVVAAGTVGVAVLVALTLLPAVMGLLGERLTPRRSRRDDGERVAAAGRGWAGRWVRAVTRVPALTVAVVVAGLLVAAVPALDLRLALPDAGTAESGSPARETYDLLSEEFGPGFNGPLVVTADIVASTDPLGLVEAVRDDVAALPGVADVPVATPNENADTMIVQVVPEGGPTSDATRQLVADLRALEPRLLEEHGVRIAVTGATAVAIDISDLLLRALLPFVLLVVGLSLVLLAMVFRSVWVPVTAAVGYLLSIGAALGAVVAVYQWGWLEGPLGTVATGPVISFMPILLLGILFGLAMDYQVFLVSRMREHHVHGEDARTAVQTGFVSAAKVVTAAALIMLSVFAAFVPEGDATLQPIALGLAVGVAVDAFLVRMVLVPAVMTLMGERAWWLPRWLDRLLPSFDVEGEGITHQLRLRSWPHPEAGPGVHADGLEVRDGDRVLLPPVRLWAEPGELLVVQGGDRVARTALAMVLTGRTVPGAGDVKVAGAVVPQESAAVRRRTLLVRAVEDPDVAAALAAPSPGRPPLVVVVENLEHVPSTRARQDALDALAALCRDGGVTGVVTVAADAAAHLRLPDDVPVGHVRLAGDLVGAPAPAPAPALEVGGPL